jgi:EpsI family protein
MKKPVIVSFILGMLMVSSGVLTKLVTPTIQIDGRQNKVNLETMIPVEFDGWKIDPSTVALVVNPDDKGLLNKIYNQTLSRTYINKEGERVMLSIAYGRDQSTDMHVHRPEICYAAGGFEIGKLTKAFADTTIGRIPVMHLVARQQARNEPITYWIRIGDSLTRGWFEQKVTAIGYGLTGKVPDGLLFRVSTISNDEQDSYRIQQAFLTAILQAVRSEDRYLLIGKLTT